MPKTERPTAKWPWRKENALKRKGSKENRKTPRKLPKVNKLFRDLSKEEDNHGT
jgi:hypothetical protein